MRGEFKHPAFAVVCLLFGLLVLQWAVYFFHLY